MLRLELCAILTSCLLLKDFAPHLFKTYPNYTLSRKRPLLHSIVNLNWRHSCLTLISSYPYELIYIFTSFTIYFIFPALLLVTDTWIHWNIVPQNLSIPVYNYVIVIYRKGRHWNYIRKVNFLPLFLLFKIVFSQKYMHIEFSLPLLPKLFPSLLPDPFPSCLSLENEQTSKS